MSYLAQVNVLTSFMKTRKFLGCTEDTKVRKLCANNLNTVTKIYIYSVNTCSSLVCVLRKMLLRDI